MLYRRVVLTAVSAVACLSAAAVYAFTSGTDEAIAVPVPDARVAGYCHALYGDLPAKVDGLSRHDLKPESELTAGWGNPPIVLRCGVPRPEILKDPNASGVTVDGVGWVIEQESGGVFRLTTTLRKAYVEVTLPKKFASDLGPLTDLADAVKKTVPEGV
ncbi:DUF3515 domain-containing protein [Streptomyces sp. NPDC087422]|uniref:DUF3515 domain-containing protein n=1 Tax=Streptomyces sp. NPDC087422 TaxID=3365786 RepID=UPI00382B2EA0